MEIQRREQIYDRLSAISMKMEVKILPDPQYINEKIGQCHVFIEEVEKFFIEVSKEMSAVQRALNNAIAGYETARDDLMATDPDIMSLPSQKDREAKSNYQLKKELKEIKHYKNDLVDLENLQKAVNVKLKNLGRINMDIKVQLRLMDSQIRIGSPSVTSEAARSLAEELSKTTVGLDVFNQAETTVDETTIVDPTVPIDVDNLLSSTTPVNDLPISKEPEGPVETGNLGLIESLTTQDSINDLPVQEEPEEPEERTLVDQLLNPLPTDPVDDFSSCMPEEIKIEDDVSGSAVDLDKVFVANFFTGAPVTQVQTVVQTQPNPIGGEQKKVEEETKIPSEPKQKEASKPKIPGEIDIDALLSQFK
jgi:hypothetical protein